ncbi:MAG: hypothetical protein PHP13_05580 [Methanomicrobium sp.]|nr:hypothetical protein [Methanomicrobium sp.]MDD4300523.1 hypothetical protein [Methanomicrobium sp.]
MREEDLDWKIYHIIAANNECPVSYLLEACGADEESVASSLKRLEKSCLIKNESSCAKILSLQETIMKISLKSELSDSKGPVVLKDGVIKANPDYKGKF